MATRMQPTTGGPTLIRWGAVLAGAVLGLAVMLLLNAFWAAAGTGAEGIARNLHWYAMFSAFAGLFIGGFIAGWITGVPGFLPGLLNGATVWAAILVATVAMGVTQALAVFQIGAEPLGEFPAGPVWAMFFSLLGGLVTAGVGGALGGGTKQPRWLYTPAGSLPAAGTHGETDVDVRQSSRSLRTG